MIPNPITTAWVCPINRYLLDWVEARSKTNGSMKDRQLVKRSARTPMTETFQSGKPEI